MKKCNLFVSVPVLGKEKKGKDRSPERSSNQNQSPHSDWGLITLLTQYTPQNPQRLKNGQYHILHEDGMKDGLKLGLFEKQLVRSTLKICAFLSMYIISQ